MVKALLPGVSPNYRLFHFAHFHKETYIFFWANFHAGVWCGLCIWMIRTRALKFDHNCHAPETYWTPLWALIQHRCMNAVTSKMVRTKLLVQSSTKTEKKKNTHTQSWRQRYTKRAFVRVSLCLCSSTNLCTKKLKSPRCSIITKAKVA